MHSRRNFQSALRSLIIIGGILSAATTSAARFQAEDYSAAYDTTPGNTGAVYRTGDVDIQATSDTGGGYNIGWVEAKEWLSFNGLNIPTTGDYLVSVRIASNSGGTLSLDLNAGSIKLADFTIPATGGWQNWQTLSKVIRINAGNYALGAYATTGGWNLNWIDIEPCNSANCGNPVPGRVEAESYSSFLDTTSGNSGGALRSGDVDIELTTDSGGGYNIGWIAPGEYLRYAVNVSTAGRYKATARLASTSSGNRFRLRSNGRDLAGAIAVPNTGNWQQWQNSSVEINLPQGVQELELYFDSGNFNVNYVDLEYLGPSGTSSSSSSASPATALKVMTYNVRTTPAGDTGERYWENRKAELVRAIQSQLPEIIGMQEATGEQQAYIKAALGSQWNLSPQGQILYRGDLFTQVQAGIIDLVADMWGKRTSEWLKLRRKADNREFIFFNNHWGVDGNSQQGSANIMRDTMGSLNQNWTLPTVLVGDLNAVPGSGPINTLSTQTPLINLYTGNTFNGWAITPNVQLDYIFINKFTKSSCNLVGYYEGSTPPSDHYPIQCELKFM